MVRGPYTSINSDHGGSHRSWMEIQNQNSELDTTNIASQQTSLQISNVVQVPVIRQSSMYKSPNGFLSLAQNESEDNNNQRHTDFNESFQQSRNIGKHLITAQISATACQSRMNLIPASKNADLVRNKGIPSDLIVEDVEEKNIDDFLNINNDGEITTKKLGLNSKDDSNVYIAIKESNQKGRKCDFENYLPSDLSQNLKAELDFIASIYDHEKIPSYFCELIRWTERHLSTISAEARQNSMQAKGLLSIQKSAVQAIFQLSSEECALQLQQIESSPVALLHLYQGDEERNYWDEFRYAGNTTVTTWLKLENCVQTLREYHKSSAGNYIDKYTYEYEGEDQGLSCKTRFIGGNICVADLKTGAWNRVDSTKAYIYVLTSDHQLIVARDLDKADFYHHSYLQHGVPVICAGEMFLKKGKIVAINNQSGHYRPGRKNFAIAINILKKQGVVSDACIFLKSAEFIPHIINSSESFKNLNKEEEDFLKEYMVPIDIELQDVKEGDYKIDYPVGLPIVPPASHLAVNRYVREFLTEDISFDS